jgi:hypothetical protein
MTRELNERVRKRVFGNARDRKHCWGEKKTERMLKVQGSLCKCEVAGNAKYERKGKKKER